MIGYTLEEISPVNIETCRKYTHPDDLIVSDRLLKKHFKGESDYYQCELRMKHKNGDWIWVLDRGKVYQRDEDGNALFMSGAHTNITLRRQTDEKIREKDIQFRKLSANLPDLIYQFTRKSDGTYFVPIASEGIKNVFGCSPEDVIDNFAPIGRVIFPEDAERVISAIEYSAKHLTYFTCEFRVQIPGKAIQWLFSRATPEKLPDGSVTWYGFNADITELKETEHSLRESEERFRSVAESAKDAIITADNEGKILMWNKAAENIFGYSTDEMTGKYLTQIIPQQLREQHAEGLKRVTHGGEHHVIGKTVEITGRHKIGKEFPIELSLSEWETPAGKFFTGIIRDITKRKQAEEKLKQLSARLSLAVRAGGIGVWDYDIVNDILDWDNQMFELYGIKKESFSNVYNSWQAGLHPEDKERGDHETQMALSGKKEFNTEFRVLWPDGIIRYIRAMAIVQRDSSGNPTRMIGTNWDITDLKKTEYNLLRAKEHAEESDRLKSAFLANMSHEIRTPMNGILGFAGLLKEADLKSKEQHEYIGIIEKSGKRMLNIISDIVNISKVEAGQMDIIVSETDVNERIEYLYKFFRPEAEAKGLLFAVNNSLLLKDAKIGRAHV